MLHWRMLRYYKIHEAAEILGVHPNTLRNWENEKRLIPLRDPQTKYRYYSKEQIRDFLLRGTNAKISTHWGSDFITQVRRDELIYADHSLDAIVSSLASTDATADAQLFPLLEQAVGRGISVRFIRNLANEQMRRRAKLMQRMGVETRHSEVQGITISIRDHHVVRLEIPSENPDYRLNILLHDPKIGQSFQKMFNLMWQDAGNSQATPSA